MRGRERDTSVLCCSTSKASRESDGFHRVHEKNYEAKGYRAPKITKLLQEEGIDVSRRGVSAFLARVEQTGDIARQRTALQANGRS